MAVNQLRTGRSRIVTVSTAAGLATLALVAAGATVPFIDLTARSEISVLVAANLALVWVARRLAGRWFSVLGMVTIAWVLYFPVRSVVIFSAQDRDISLHPLVRTASQADLVWAMAFATAGLAMMLLGASIAPRLINPGPSRVEPERATLLIITIGGIAVAAATTFFHLSSGILSNIGAIALFGIAAMSFGEARRGIRVSTLMAVGVAMTLGAMVGYKEQAMMPVVAWAIGYFAGRGRGRMPWAVFGVALTIGVFGYAGVAGQRIANDYGESRGFAAAAAHAITRDDLVTGKQLFRQKHPPEMVTNLLRGLSRRVAATDSLLVLHARVPRDVGFVHGRSLVEPALSVVPGMKRILKGTDFDRLSLGRYFSVRFYSVQPASDPSSQAITVLGDFFLNFGVAGGMLGMLAFGFLLGAIDTRFPAASAFNVGVLGYAGTAFLGIERNAAYVVVNIAIRLGIVLLLQRFLTAANSQAGYSALGGIRHRTTSAVPT